MHTARPASEKWPDVATATTAAAAVRTSRPWRGALLALVGLFCAAGGAGLGIRHLQKTGFSVITVVGLLLLAAGLALLGVGCSALWRAGSVRQRLWFAPGTVAALAVGWSVTFAVMATVVPPTATVSDTPEAHGLTEEEVRIDAVDGVPLSAWWVPASNGAAVLLLHGAGENRAATLAQAEVLARHGYGVLMLDARGHGRSEGRGMDLGWYGDVDIRAALDWLDGRRGVDSGRIGLLGLSMGAEEAIGASAADDRIRAVVAEGATGRTAADKAAWLPAGVLGTIQRAWDALTYGFVDLLTPAGPPIALPDAVARAGGTLFLVVTAGTEPDEGRAAEALRNSAPDRVTVWSVSGARHTHALAAEPSAWEDRVTTFLDSALAG
jgi:pimeloyl-ACP methyl ester carboxylesterase